MSKDQKLLKRFLSIPVDFTWDELVTFLGNFDFDEEAGSGGSYRCFISAQGRKIFLHKPHPNNIVKRYALRQVKDKLIEYGVTIDPKGKK